MGGGPVRNLAVGNLRIRRPEQSAGYGLLRRAPLSGSLAGGGKTALTVHRLRLRCSRHDAAIPHVHCVPSAGCSVPALVASTGAELAMAGPGPVPFIPSVRAVHL